MPQLSITKTSIPDTVKVGEEFTYTVTVKNISPLLQASGVTVTDFLPAGICVTGIHYSIGTIDFDQETIAWNIGTLFPSATATLAITAVAQQAGTITNSASVSADGLSPAIIADASTTVEPVADLAIYKQSCSSNTTLGGSLTYLVTVVNNGPSAATGVTVTDTFTPDDTVIHSVTSSQGGCNPPIGNIATCNLGTLLPHSVATIAITAIPASAGTVQNTAAVTSAVYDPSTTNNTASLFATVALSADLSITKTVSPAIGVIGSPVTYTMTVTNNGPSPASAATIEDIFPDGLIIDSASCPFTGQKVTCTVPTLAVGESQTFTVIATPTTTGLFTNTVTVSAETPGPNLCNNTATASLLVGAVTGTNLTITKSHTPDTVLVCTPLTLTLRVKNEGPVIATGVMLVDQLPAGVDVVSISASQGNCCYPWQGCCSPEKKCCQFQDCCQPAISCPPNRDVVCQLGSLAIGASATVQITVRPRLAGTLVNTALVSSNQDDLQPADNQAIDTVSVITPQEQLDALTAIIVELVNSGIVEAPLGHSLLYYIKQAGKSLACGACQEAHGALQYFTQEISCLLARDILPPTVEGKIVESVNQLKAYILCPC